MFIRVHKKSDDLCAILRPWLNIFVIFGPFYPVLRVELISYFGLPSPVLGAWVDLISIALGFLMISHLRRRETRPIVEYAVWAVVVAGGFSIFFGSDLLQIGYGLRQTYFPIVFFFVGLRFGLVWTHTERLWKMLVTVLAVSALSGIVLTLLIPEYWVSLYLSEAGNSRDWGLGAISREGGLRMTGAIMDPVIFGTLCSWGSILSLSAYFVARKRKNLLGLAFVVCLLGVIMSLSRGAWFGTVIGLLILLGFNLNWITSRRFIFFVVSFALIAAMATNFQNTEIIFDVVSRTVDKTVSEGNAQRDDQFNGVINNLPSRLLGNGLGNVGHVGERFSADGKTSDGYEHITDSWYMKLLAEGGIPLFLAFLAYLFASFFTLARALIGCRDPQRRALLSALLGIQLMVIVQAAVSNIWDLYYLSQLLWLFGGLAAAFRPARVTRRLVMPSGACPEFCV